MNVRHDRSYISENSRNLIGRGYAAEVLDTLRFRFTYTQVERDANRSRAQTQPYADGIAERAKAAMLRSAEMEQIMATIAEQFVCYQYDDRKYPFRDGGWDLFFWCNCFFNTMPGHGLDGRDYSYFTLSFNEQHTAEKRKEICDSVLTLINEKFPANPHLDIALQYSALLDYTRIKAETAAVTPKLIGKTCSFRGKDGRIQQVEDKIFFFPKRYRRYGCPLDDMDLLILPLQQIKCPIIMTIKKQVKKAERLSIESAWIKHNDWDRSKDMLHTIQHFMRAHKRVNFSDAR